VVYFCNMDFLFLNGNLVEIVRVIGYAGVTCVIFAESGIFLGFFLPGDSMLFTAGLLASQGFFNIYGLVALTGLAAAAGDSVGYWFGNLVGPTIFSKENSRFFKKDNVQKAHAFYEKHGPKAIVLGRFVPMVRTFVPIVAGVAKMSYPIFLRYNIIGALIWGMGVPVVGYVLGSVIPSAEKYMLPIALGIIAISFIPMFTEYRGTQKRRAHPTRQG